MLRNTPDEENASGAGDLEGVGWCKAYGKLSGILPRIVSGGIETDFGNQAC
jgi:hypothetical protein